MKRPDFVPSQRIIGRRRRAGTKSVWMADLYRFSDGTWVYGLSGDWYNEVLPYTIETQRLLGTDTDWEYTTLRQ